MLVPLKRHGMLPEFTWVRLALGVLLMFLLIPVGMAIMRRQGPLAWVMGVSAVGFLLLLNWVLLLLDF